MDCPAANENLEATGFAFDHSLLTSTATMGVGVWVLKMRPLIGDVVVWIGLGGQKEPMEFVELSCGGGLNGGIRKGGWCGVRRVGGTVCWGNPGMGNHGKGKPRDESRRGRPVARRLHSSNSFRPFNDGTFCKRAHIARPRSFAAIV
jgi:hypothetical protein